MVDPTGTARGHRHILSGYAPWITATQACLIIAMLVMAGGVMCRCRPAQGADQRPAAQTIAPGGTLTFDEAVKIAITQSPYFRQKFPGYRHSADGRKRQSVWDGSPLDLPHLLLCKPSLGDRRPASLTV